jgi:DNA polymerase III gamma/tau subunit
VAEALGNSAQQSVTELFEAILQKDAVAITTIIGNLRDQNIQENYFYKMLFSALHQVIIQETTGNKSTGVISAKVARFLTTNLLKANLQQYSPIPFLPLEICLLDLVEKAIRQSSPPSVKKKIINSDQNPEQNNPAKTLTESPLRELVIQEEVVSAAITQTTTTDHNLRDLGKVLVEQWEQFLQLVQQRNATLAALLRSSKPSLTDDGTPQVGVFYKFHQEQLQQQKYMSLIQDCAKDVVGASLPMRVALRHTPQRATLVEIEKTPGNLSQLAEEVLL